MHAHSMSCKGSTADDVELDGSLDGIHDGLMVEPFRRVSSYGSDPSIGSEATSEGCQACRGGFDRGSGKLAFHLLPELLYPDSDTL